MRLEARFTRERPAPFVAWITAGRAILAPKYTTLLPCLLLALYLLFECVYFLINTASLPLPSVPSPQRPKHSEQQLLRHNEEKRASLSELQALLTNSVRLRKAFERLLKLRNTLRDDSQRFTNELGTTANLTKESEAEAMHCVQKTDDVLRRGLALDPNTSASSAARIAYELRDWEISILAKIREVREQTLEHQLREAMRTINSEDSNVEVERQTKIKEVLLSRSPFSYLNMSILIIDKEKEEDVDEMKKKIVGLSGVRNAVRQLSHFVESLSKVVDSIILLDDASDDGTPRLAEELLVLSQYSTVYKVEAVIEKKVWQRDETFDKNVLLRVGREIARGTHFVYLDYDEAFADSCVVGDPKNNDPQGFDLRTSILNLTPGQQMKLEWVLFWNGTTHYRKNFLSRDLIVIFADLDPSLHYAMPDVKRWGVQLHTKRLPGGLSAYDLIDASAIPTCKLLEFRFVTVDNTRLKEAWYYGLGVLKGNYRATAPGYSNHLPAVHKTKNAFAVNINSTVDSLDSLDGSEIGEDEDSEDEESPLTLAHPSWMGDSRAPVSYTHLTLPTILRV
eukprot:TRINITY_DN1915_c0_g1_i3.p1 TRINITY_DN1915_c0_g1~~TRINITY_DN1915_c0_g1_i3.p1  ORF type:complete len:565 (-),score=103.76 TRINITY_DN1915_c0_g1_i3:10-1704(-)